MIEPNKSTVADMVATTHTQNATMKLLCPNKMVGAIIGKGGSTLRELKELSHSEIRLSQDSEFFPESSDRIIAISGPVEHVRQGIAIVLTKMFEVGTVLTLPLPMYSNS